MSKRILIVGFRHETNTFSKLPTDMAAFEARSLHRGVEIAPAYRGTKTEVAAFMDACPRHGWTPIPVVVSDATPLDKVIRHAAAVPHGPCADFDQPLPKSGQRQMPRRLE